MVLDPLGTPAGEPRDSDASGGLVNPLPARPISKAPAAPQQAPTLWQRLVSTVTPSPEPQPGDMDYAQPLAPPRPPVTDLSQRLLNDAEVDELAGTPGFLHTIGEEIGTREGLTQKIPWFGQLPPATKVIQAWQASQRLKSNQYANEDDSLEDARTITSFLNETRIRDRMEKKRSFWGSAVALPLRSIPFAGEILLSNLIGKRFGISAPKLAGLGAGGEAAVMSGTRMGYVKLLNKFIGENGEKLVADRLKAYAEVHGSDVVQEALRTGSKDLMAKWIQEAKQGLARNIISRSEGGALMAKMLPAAEVDVAKKLIENNAMLRLSSRSLEIATRLPFMATGKLLAAGPQRQLERGGMVVGNDGKITFTDTGESLKESVLKGVTNEYFEYLSEYSGGELQRIFKWGMPRHLAQLKIADLAAKLPDKGPVLGRIKKIMDSPAIARGFKVGGRFMNKAAREMAIYDPLSEYGEEVINMVGQSVFNLNDDGKTPWATRVVQSLFHPVFHPKEALTMLVGFSLFPAGAFVAGSALGRLTDEEVARNKAAFEALIGDRPTHGGVAFRDADQARAAALAFDNLLQMEHKNKDDSSLLSRTWARVFNTDVRSRPGSALSFLEKSTAAPFIKEQKVNLRDGLLNLPQNQRLDVLTRVLTLAADTNLVEKLADNPEDQEAFKTFTGIARKWSEAYELVNTLIPGAVGILKDPISVSPVAASEQEQKQDPLHLKYKAVVENISVPRLEGALKSMTAALSDPRLSAAGRARLAPLVTELQTATAKLTGASTDKSLLNVVKKYARVLYDNVDEQEARGTGLFSVKERVKLADLEKPGNQMPDYLKSWSARGKLAELKDTLRAALQGDEDREVFYIPGIGVELADEAGWKDLGYEIPRGGQKASYGFVVPAVKGVHPERVYLTDISTPLDLAHEAAHPREEDIAKAVARALIEYRNESEAVGAETGLKQGWKQLSEYLDAYVPEIKGTGHRLSVSEYLEGVKNGSFPLDRQFAEDMVNLMALYMGHEHGLPRQELHNARMLFAHLKESPRFIHGLETIISGKKVIKKGKEVWEGGSPLLSRMHRRAPTERSWSSVQAYVDRLDGKREPAAPAQRKAAAKPAPKVEPVEEAPQEALQEAPQEAPQEAEPDERAKLEAQRNKLLGRFMAEKDPEAAKKLKERLDRLHAQLAGLNKKGKKKVTPPPAPQKTPKPVKEASAPGAKPEEKPAPDAVSKPKPRAGGGRNIGPPSRHSLGELPEKRDFFLTARVLAVNKKHLGLPLTAAGLIDWDAFDARMLETGLGSRLTKEGQQAYFALVKAPVDLVRSIFDDPADIWKPKLVSWIKATRDEELKELTDLLKATDKPTYEEAQAALAFQDTGEQDADFMPNSVIHGEAEDKIKYYLKRAAAFLQILDLSFGAKQADMHFGKRNLPVLMQRLSGGRWLLKEVFYAALYSKGDFNKMLEDPAGFFRGVAKGAAIPDSLMSFWTNNLAPTLKVHSYDELQDPKQELTLADILGTTGLCPTWVAVWRGEGERARITLRQANVSKAESNRILQEANRRTQQVFKRSVEAEKKARDAGEKSKTSATARVWAAEAKRVKAASPLFKDMPWKKVKEAIKGAVVRDENGNPEAVKVEVLTEGLKMLDAYLPAEKLGVPFSSMVELLDDSESAARVQAALNTFLYHLDVNSFPSQTPQNASRNMQLAFAGGTRKGRTDIGVLEAIYEEVLGKDSTKLDTTARIGGKQLELRRGAGLIELLNRGHNVRALKELELVAPDTENLVLADLRGAQGVLDEDGVRKGYTDKEWTGDDRLFIARQLLTSAQRSKSKSPLLWMPLVPFGNKTVMTLLKVRYINSGKELVRLQKQAWEWAEKHGGTDHLTHPDKFKARYENATSQVEIGRGNWALHTMVLQRMMIGVCPPYKNVMGAIKRGAYVKGGDMPSKIPSATGIRSHIGAMRISNLGLAPAWDGVEPVTPKEGDKAPIPWMDGMILVTDLGAKEFHLDQDTASIKSLITWVNETYHRYMLKGNSVYVTKDTMPNMDPRIVKLLEWANEHNRLHPDNPIHLITMQENMKVMPSGYPAATKALSWSDKGDLVFHLNEGSAVAVDRIPTSAFFVVANLKASVEPSLQTVDAQMLAGTPVSTMGIIRDIIFTYEKEIQDRLPSLRGTFSEFKKAMESYWRDEDEDQYLKRLVDEDVDIRKFPELFGQRISRMIYAKLRNATAKFFAIRAQTVDDLHKPDAEPKVTQFVDREGKDLVGEALNTAADTPGEVFVDPGDMYTNNAGARVEQDLDFVSAEADPDKAVLEYLWENRNKWPDVFQSRVVKEGGKVIIQLEKRLEPSVKKYLYTQVQEVAGGTKYTFNLRGEYCIGPRTPNSGSECVTLFRAKGRVGKGQKNNWTVVNGRTVFYAGEDFDGDSRFNYIAAKDKHGNPAGHSVTLVDKDGVIAITPPGEIKWNEKSMASLTFQLLAYGMSHPQESPSYFNPRLGVNPVLRRLSTGPHGKEAEKQMESLRQLAKEGWDSPEMFKLMLRLPGDLQAIGVSVRQRAILQEILDTKESLLKRPVSFNLFGAQFSWSGRFEPRHAALLRDTSGDIMGLVADTLKDLYAPTLHYTQDYLGLVYSIFMANYRMEYLMIADNDNREDVNAMLRSVEGTLHLIQTQFFTPAMLSMLNKSGFSGNKLIPRAEFQKKEYNLWRDASINGLLRLATSLAKYARWFDMHRSVTEEKAAGFLKEITKAGFEEQEEQLAKELGRSYTGRFVFDLAKIRNTPHMLRTQDTVQRALDILPTADPRLAEPANRAKLTRWIRKKLGAEFDKNYDNLLENVVWEHLDNRFVSQLTPGEALETGWDSSVKMHATNRLPDRGVPVNASRVIEGVDALETYWEAFNDLPEDLQHALTLLSFEQFGLGNLQTIGSYAARLPPSAILWLQSEIDQALGGKGAAAPVPREAEKSAPGIKTPPSAASSKPGVTRIVSGGQTGADQAGLQAARLLGLETGGVAPVNFATERGTNTDLQKVFGLRQVTPAETKAYTGKNSLWGPRTELNVVNSDGTVIFGKLSPGSRLTISHAKQHSKPFIANPTAEKLREWLIKNNIKVLNVAGNRESVTPGINKHVQDVLQKALKEPASVQEAVEQGNVQDVDVDKMTPEDLAVFKRLQGGNTPKLNASLGELELMTHSAETLDPTSSLHKEMRTRFSFVEKMVDMTRLGIGELYRAAGQGKHDVPILEALSYFLDSGKNYDTKVRLASNVQLQVRMEFTPAGPDTVETFTDTAPTVRKVVDDYEAFRRSHPEMKLKSFAELLPIAVPLYRNARIELNKHASEFSENEELFADITKSKKVPVGAEYIQHRTMSPFGLDIGIKIRAALNEWYELPAGKRGQFRVTINPQGAVELAGAGKLGLSEEEVREGIASHNLLARMKDPKEREAAMQKAVEAVKERLSKLEAKLLTEYTGRTEARTMSLQEKFKEYGHILTFPNYGQSVEQYVKETSDYAASLRYLSYMANLTDFRGIPAAFFMKKAKGPDDKNYQEQKLLSKATLRSMFFNWHRQLKIVGIDVEDYDYTKDVWENLSNLERSALNAGWFKANGYVEVELKNTEGLERAWVLEGATKKLLDHVTSRGVADLKKTGLTGILRKMLQGLIWFNQMTKQLALSISFFHAATLMESHVSSYGITKRNPLLPWNFFREVRDVWKLSKEAITEPKWRSIMAGWMDNGLTFRFSDRDPLDTDPRSEGGPMDRLLDRGAAIYEKHPVLGAGFKAASVLKRNSDHLLWEVLQPASKLMMAERTFNEVMHDPAYDHLVSTPEGRAKVRTEIAQVTNQAFGGLDWREMVWATPLMRDALRAVVFAPDWTFANLQMAMVPDLLQKVSGVRMPFGPTAETNIRTKFLIEKNWPSFLYITLVVVPAVWQGLIYAAFGDPDDGDQPFMWMNEEGKQASVDVTPIHRALGSKFGITKKRRTYLQWGKSGYEIADWFKSPWKAFLGKTSLGVKALWENLTGRNTAGWDMPWAKEDVSAPLGGLFMVNGSIADSRLSYIGQKFIPMTLLNYLSKDKPSTLFAPVGLGKSSYAAERQIADILQAYGDETLWAQLKGKPEQVKRLETLVESTVRAAWLNGYDVKQIMSAARGLAHGRQAAEFFEVLEKNPKNPNLAKLERIARAYRRTDGAAKSFNKAIGNRFEKQGNLMTPRQRAILTEAWQKAGEKRGEQ